MHAQQPFTPPLFLVFLAPHETATAILLVCSFARVLVCSFPRLAAIHASVFLFLMYFFSLKGQTSDNAIALW
jgi:hypothetical protein